MARRNEERYTAVAKVVKIDTTRNDLSGKNSYQNNAFVEFTDYNGELGKGSFRIDDTPLYTTIRVNSVVEIEYDKDKFLGSYTVFLLNPELYERVPTEEELAPYKRNRKRVLRQSLMAVPAIFIAMVLYGLTHSFLVIAAMVVITYLIMKFDSKQAQADQGKFLSWYEKDES